MPRGKAGFACPLCHVGEMFICLGFFECHKIRSVHVPGGGGYCHIWAIWAIWVSAAVKGMFFKQFTLG